MLGDWIFDCRFSTWVASALAGSHDDESFFSAPVSLPDSGPARATMISQKTTTPHLARRPLAKVMMARARLMLIPRQSMVWLPRVAETIGHNPVPRQDISQVRTFADLRAAPNARPDRACWSAHAPEWPEMPDWPNEFLP